MRRLLEQNEAELRRCSLNLPVWRDLLRSHGRNIAAAWRHWEHESELRARLAEVAASDGLSIGSAGFRISIGCCWLDEP
ncbi:hypothetical protein DYH09_32255 [bacterium CPR1]|nr:hypothetical protein [bacterium CPR1]